MLPIEFTTLEWIIISVIALAFLIQMGIYLNIFLRVALYKPRPVSNQTPPVSIIICARNEETNLRNHLPLIFNQDYPSFEVIVVNDGSEDDTDLFLSVLKSQQPNFYYTTIPSDKKFVHSKKLALTLGIKAAKHNLLLFTDADCKPVSSQWIAEMVKGISDEKQLVIGYSPYEKRKGMLNRLIRYDCFWNGAHYLGYALKGQAMMGVGRNLAYTKQLFQKSGGFTKHIYLASGDDDLFINQVATKNNSSVVMTQDSLMMTLPAESYEEWHRQKSRHLTTSTYYRFSNRFKFIAEAVSRQLLWLAAISSAIFHNFALIACSALIIKLIVQTCILSGAAKKLNEKKIYWSTFIFDFLLPIILIIFHIENLFRTKQVKWK